MTTTGPNYPTSAVDDASAGGTSLWSNPTYVEAVDTNYATTIPGSSGALSHYLLATGFGFAIPAGSTIVGILAEINGYVTNSPTNTLNLKLNNGSGYVGSVKTSPLDASTPSTKTAGGNSDDWSAGLTAAQVNSPGFGIGIQTVGARTGETTDINWVRLTVYYNPPPVSNNQFFALM